MIRRREPKSISTMCTPVLSDTHNYSMIFGEKNLHYEQWVLSLAENIPKIIGSIILSIDGWLSMENLFDIRYASVQVRHETLTKSCWS